MKFTIDKKENCTILKLDEEKLNSLLAPALKSELLILSNEGSKNIILDISQVTFIDSSGLSAILIGNRMCKNVDGLFVLAGAQDNVQKLLTISQLDNILEIIPTISEATDYIMMEQVEKGLKNEE